MESKRTQAQREADKRYRLKNKYKEARITFFLKKDEATEIERIITASGRTKVDFLRAAVKAHKDGKF